MWYQNLFIIVFILLFKLMLIEMTHHQHMSSSLMKMDFNAHAVYNKLYHRSLNLTYASISSIEPRNKLWFAIENATVYALPLFGDYPGPFHIQLLSTQLIELNFKFHFTPSKSLFSPSNHLLLALFNISSTNFHRSTMNRYHLIQTLSSALNLSTHFLTVHKINGTMIKVYFSCDFYNSSTNNLTYQIQNLVQYYYTNRIDLIKQFSLPLIEISIIRLSKSSTVATTPIMFELKKAAMTIRSRLSKNQTSKLLPSSSSTIHFQQFYQPLVLVPLIIILLGLILCTIIAFCLCCNRHSSSTSTLLLPTNAQHLPINKHLYQNYNYHKYRQQDEYFKRNYSLQDQRQFISKGIPVVFAEELEEKLEQTHTPLVMRIEKAPF